MFPLGDETRRPRNYPAVTVLIIGINAIVFLLEIANGEAFVGRWSLVPAHIVAGHDLATLFSSMFMHGSWLHFGGNMIYLWAFGPVMEDCMGRARYAGFYVLGGLAAMATQVVGDPHSAVPVLGASGAIAAVMGGFLITFPGDRIRTVIFLGLFTRLALVPAVALIGFWLLLQLVSVGAVSGAEGQGGVAYLAHVGGAVFGLATARLFERR